MAKRKSSLFSAVLESLGFSRRKPQKSGKQRLLKLEPLENRRLLTATVMLNQAYTITDDGSHLFEAATAPYAGDLVNITITATNVGDTSASNVLITDDLSGTAADQSGLQGGTLTGTPKASSPQLGSVPVPTVGASNKLLTFQGTGTNGFVLPAGDSVSVSFSVLVNPAAFGSFAVSNSLVTAVAPCNYFDGTQSQDMSAPQSIYVEALPGTPTPLINLVVGQTVASGPDTAGNVTYNASVTNNGPSAAQGVQFSDATTDPLAINAWKIVGTLPNGSSVENEETGLNVTDSTSQIGDLLAMLDLPVGATVHFQITGTMAPGYSEATNTVQTFGSPAADVDVRSQPLGHYHHRDGAGLAGRRIDRQERLHGYARRHRHAGRRPIGARRPLHDHRHQRRHQPERSRHFRHQPGRRTLFAATIGCDLDGHGHEPLQPRRDRRLR